MKASSYIKRFFCQGALIYTALSGLLATIFAASTIDSASMSILSPTRQLNLLLFAYLLSLADTFFSAKQINAIVRHIAHPSLYLGAFAFCILLPAGKDDNGFWAIFGVFTVFYVAARVIIFFITRKFKTQKEGVNKSETSKKEKDPSHRSTFEKEQKHRRKKEEEYHSLFSDKK